ncbi:hypothetical protein ACRAWD_11340 [Caulobacter segnis]
MKVLARAEDPYPQSIDDVWRRDPGRDRGLCRWRLAEADAFRPSLRLARREAGWSIKGLRDTRPYPCSTKPAPPSRGMSLPLAPEAHDRGPRDRRGLRPWPASSACGVTRRPCCVARWRPGATGPARRRPRAEIDSSSRRLALSSFARCRAPPRA